MNDENAKVDAPSEAPTAENGASISASDVSNPQVPNPPEYEKMVSEAKKDELSDAEKEELTRKEAEAAEAARVAAEDSKASDEELERLQRQATLTTSEGVTQAPDSDAQGFTSNPDAQAHSDAVDSIVDPAPIDSTPVIDEPAEDTVQPGTSKRKK